jgi:hypothetical protein
MPSTGARPMTINADASAKLVSAMRAQRSSTHDSTAVPASQRASLTDTGAAGMPLLQRQSGDHSRDLEAGSLTRAAPPPPAPLTAAIASGAGASGAERVRSIELARNGSGGYTPPALASQGADSKRAAPSATAVVPPPPPAPPHLQGRGSSTGPARRVAPAATLKALEQAKIGTGTPLSGVFSNSRSDEDDADGTGTAGVRSPVPSSKRRAPTASVPRPLSPATAGAPKDSNGGASGTPLTPPASSSGTVTFDSTLFVGQDHHLAALDSPGGVDLTQLFTPTKYKPLPKRWHGDSDEDGFDDDEEDDDDTGMCTHLSNAVFLLSNQFKVCRRG